MRQEQALLDQRRSAILGQLTSLSALAAETAGNLPEVPEILFSDFESVASRSDHRQAAPAPTAEHPDGSDEATETDDASADEDATTVRYLDTRSA